MAKGDNLTSELSDNEFSYLMQFLKDEGLRGDHMEIGTASGGTLWNLIKNYSDDVPHFVVIDPMNYFPDQLSLIKKNLRNNGVDPDIVEFRVSSSDAALKNVGEGGERYDFIFIDGSHKLKYVMKDLRWTRYLATGGILCLHDYHSNTKGVMLAADSFLEKYPNYQKIKLIDRLMIIRKTGETPCAEVSTMDIVYANIMTLLIQLRRSIEKRVKKLKK